MRWHILFLSTLLVLSPVIAIFADDAFSIDYHQALLGIPQSHTTFFHKPSPASNASLLYTISDKAVFGAINPRDGSVLWRHALGGQPQEGAAKSYLVRGEKDGRLTTGFENNVNSWDAADGRLAWTQSFPLSSTVLGLQTTPAEDIGYPSQAQDVVVLTRSSGSSHSITRLAGDGSGVRWQFRDTSGSADSLPSIYVSSKLVIYVSKSSGLLSGTKAQIIQLDVNSGQEVNRFSSTIGSEVLDTGEQADTTCSNGPFLASSESPYNTLKVVLLVSGKALTLNLEDKKYDARGLKLHHACEAGSGLRLLVHSQGATRNWAEVFHIDTTAGSVQRAYSLPAIAEDSDFAASSSASSTYFVRVSTGEVTVYSSESHGQLGRWTRTDGSSSKPLVRQSVHAASEVASRSGSSVAVRMAITTSSGDWYLIRNGEVQWSRPEMLAYTKIAVWADQIESDSLVQELKQEVVLNPLSAYVHRATRHVQELMSLPHKIVQLLRQIPAETVDQAVSTRSVLVGSRSVLVVTSRSQLLALDASNLGSIQWHSDLSLIVKTGSAAKALAYQDGNGRLEFSDGSVVVFNVSDGAIVHKSEHDRPFTTSVELKLDGASVAIALDKDGNPSAVGSEVDEGNFVVAINQEGEAVGWTLGPSVKKTWTFRPAGSSKIVKAVARPAHDPVASIGKVLGNRSVLYKYLSPNLVLLTALSSTSLSMYLIDAVTGASFFSATHEGVLTHTFTPSAISENWFAYSFTSADPENHAISTKIVIAELYESETPNDRGMLSAKANYSSFSADSGARPFLISQAYTIAEPVSEFVVTQTAQGITSRQLCAVLPESNAIMGIPRHVLDARRPVDRDPTSAELEEGLFRYSPILDLDPKFFLSHSREVIGVTNLISTPTLLESTSMLFAYGHDLFGTLVAPSMTFDVLGKTFNKIQLVLTVVALYVGVVALGPLVRSKAVERTWQ